MTSRDELSGVLDSALSRLREIGLNVRVDELRASPQVVLVRQQDRDIAYEVHVVSRPSPSTAHLHSETRLPPLMIAPFIGPKIADSWRQQEIAFVDTAGNAFFNAPGLFIDVRGRPRPQDATLGPKTLRAFKNNGLRIIFVLLCDPSQVASPYREVARLSTTSLGTVHGVLAELQAMGYISGGEGVRRLHRLHDLFKRWVDAYSFDLYPRLMIAAFDAPDANWWRHATEAVQTEGGQWGAEVAAHFLGSRLVPAHAAIYAPAVPSKLAIQQRFQRASGTGNVEIRQRFWALQQPQESPIVPTPLIYADLLASGDPRNVEAAEYLKETDEALRRLTER